VSVRKPVPQFGPLNVGNVTQKGPMDILVQSVRNEGVFSLYKGKDRRRCVWKPTHGLLDRYGKPIGGGCSSQLSPLCCIQRLEACCYTLPGHYSSTGSFGRVDGRCRQLCSCKSRYVLSLLHLGWASI